MTQFVITNEHIMPNGTFDKSIIPHGTTDLLIRDSTSLTTLPNGLRVDGKLTILGCSNLTYLPNLRLSTLNLTHCSGLPSNTINIRQLEDLEKFGTIVLWPKHLRIKNLEQDILSSLTDSKQLINLESPRRDYKTYRQSIEAKRQRLSNDKSKLQNNDINKADKNSKISLLSLKQRKLSQDVDLLLQERPDLADSYIGFTYIREALENLKKENDQSFYTKYITCLNSLEKTHQKLIGDLSVIKDFIPLPTSLTVLNKLTPVSQNSITSQNVAFPEGIVRPKPRKFVSSPLIATQGHTHSVATARNNSNANSTTPS